MIIFLYGEDSYRIREKLNEVVASYQKTNGSGLNLKYYSGGDFRDLKDNSGQSAMFSEEKLFVIVDPFDDTYFKEEFPKQKSFVNSPDIIVVIQNGKVKKNSVLLKYMLANAKTEEFELLAGAKLNNWIRDEVGKYRGKIDNAGVNLLAEYVGNDLWRMSQEIKKLICYDGNIFPDNIRSLVRPKIETDIFSTIEAIARKDKQKALGLLRGHIEKGESPLYILSMINFQFRNLLVIKDLANRGTPHYQISKKSGLHPFVIKKAGYLIDSFSFDEIKKIYGKIYQIDGEIKSGRVEPLIALDLLVVAI